jgi:hypothetical protein
MRCQEVFEAVQAMGHGTEFIRSVIRKEVTAVAGIMNATLFVLVVV